MMGKATGRTFSHQPDGIGRHRTEACGMAGIEGLHFQRPPPLT